MESLLKMFYPNGTFSILSLIISIILVFVVIKAVYEAIKWIIDRLNGYHEARKIKQKQEERIETLENHDKQQSEEILKIEDEITKIIALLENIKETQSSTIRETNKGVIFRIYHDVIRQGSISQTELDRFMEAVEIYKKEGGDGVVDEKICPEVLKFPIEKEY